MKHTPSIPETPLRLERHITLPGAIALVVGGVIGAGIFVMVRDIGAQAGQAIWLSFAVAIAVSLVGVVPVIQLAGALPRAGAGYLFASRLLSPCVGVLTSAWVILGGACSTSVVARTLAQYMQDYAFSGAPVGLMAAAILLAFYGVYCFGVRLAMSLQMIMAAQFLLALMLYGVAGAFHSGLAMSVTPLRGGTGFLMSVLLSYATCMGFQVVAEMGEEIKDARRVIPLALLIGGAIIVGIYILVGTVFVNSVPYDAALYGAMNAPLRESAALFLPIAAVHFVGLGAMTAGLTSLNAAAIALPRELFAQARDGMLPAALAQVDRRTGAPQRAVTLFFLIVAALLIASLDTEFYGYMAAIGILAISSSLGVAALRLPSRFPDRYAGAYIHFPMPVLAACTVVTLLVSLGFGAVVAAERPSVLVVYACWTGMVALYYRMRTRNFSAGDWRRIAAIPGEDEASHPQG